MTEAAFVAAAVFCGAVFIGVDLGRIARALEGLEYELRKLGDNAGEQDADGGDYLDPPV